MWKTKVVGVEMGCPWYEHITILQGAVDVAHFQNRQTTWQNLPGPRWIIKEYIRNSPNWVQVHIFVTDVSWPERNTQPIANQSFFNSKLRGGESGPWCCSFERVHASDNCTGIFFLIKNNTLLSTGCDMLGCSDKNIKKSCIVKFGKVQSHEQPTTGIRM